MSRAWMGAALVLALTGPALAQPEEPAEGAEAAEGAEVAESETEQAEEPAEDPRLIEARERIARAQALYDEENYEAALAEFERTVELLQGHNMRFMVLFNIGRCQEKLFRYQDAMTSYRAFLSEGGEFTDQAADVRAKIELLEGLLGTVNISVSVAGYQVWVGDRLIGENVSELLLPSGTHAVEIRKDGYVANQQQAQVVARSEVELTFEMERLAEEYEGLSPALFWTATGITVASLLVGATFGGLALSRSNEIDGRDPALATRDEADEIGTYSLTADVMFGVALLGATTAVIFALFTDWGGEDDESAGLRLQPVAGRNEAGLVLGGSF